jgi:hypothetical protein
MNRSRARSAALHKLLDYKSPIQGLGAESEEKHEPVSDIDTVAVDSLKALDPKRPIREADIQGLNRSPHLRARAAYLES